MENLVNVKLNFIGQVSLAIIVFIIVLYIFNYIFSYTKRFIKSYKGTVEIVDGLKNAERRFYISNDPSNKSYLDIPRSYNEENGIEFTYQFWLLVDNWNIKQEAYKHIFHKGNEIKPIPDSPNMDFDYPLLNAPGVYLDKTENKLNIIMNTFEDPGRGGDTDNENPLEVPNIPIGKWIAITITLNGQVLKVYKNGYLANSKVLESYPRQNNSPIWINDMNGFSGFISKLTYYNYAIPQNDIEAYVNAGPTLSACLSGRDVPKYISNTYIEGKPDL